jgi:hypothetical protein
MRVKKTISSDVLVRRRAQLADLLARVQRRPDRARLVVNFWTLGPRFWIELLAHLDREHGVGDEIEAAVRRELGWPPDAPDLSTPTAAGRPDQLAMRRRLAARRLQQQQRAVALHRRGAVTGDHRRAGERCHRHCREFHPPRACLAALGNPRRRRRPARPTRDQVDPMILVTFRRFTKNSLRALATIELPNGLTIVDCPVHVTNGLAWASLPAKAALDRERRQIVVDGKPQYAVVLKWRDRDLAGRFSDAVVKLVRAAHPDAFGDGGEP